MVVASGTFAYYWFLIRGPLAGNTSHNFGEVIITRLNTEVSHTFELVNRTNRELIIDRVIPECGCLNVSPMQGRVEPGGTFQLQATLAVSSNGTKTTPIRLIYADGSSQFLHLKATGKRIESPDPGANAPNARPAPEGPSLPPRLDQRN